MLTIHKFNVLNQFNLYYKLKSDTLSINWSGFKTKPNYAKLKTHFNSLIRSDKFVYYFTESENLIGYLQFSINNDQAEVDGYSVLSQHTGKGYGTQIIKFIYEIINTDGSLANIKRIIAWVSENNMPSINCFIKNGFKIDLQSSKYVKLEAFNRTDKFILLELKINQESL